MSYIRRFMANGKYMHGHWRCLQEKWIIKNTRVFVRNTGLKKVNEIPFIIGKTSV